MRTITILFLSISFIVSAHSQINKKHNAIRAGDAIIKQQVEYKEHCEAEANPIWDFSELSAINKEYMLTYSSAPLQGDSLYVLGDYTFRKEDVSSDELVVGSEHHTMYYYHIKDDSLLLLGHENPIVKLQYIEPFFVSPYPLSIGQTKASSYTTKGLYSGKIKVQTYGEVIVSADSYGTMILPTGDTLSPVLRVKTIHTIGEIIEDVRQPVTKQAETHRWYTKGYRYPIFETIKKTDILKNNELFKTAFYYPPQEHLYLDTDPENQKLLEEMWNMEDKTDNSSKTISLEDIMICKIYPNPVTTSLNLEYELKKDANVSFQLYTISGTPIKLIYPKRKSTGVYRETIDCSGLPNKGYILKITADDIFVNEVVIKK